MAKKRKTSKKTAIKAKSKTKQRSTLLFPNLPLAGDLRGAMEVGTPSGLDDLPKRGTIAPKPKARKKQKKKFVPIDLVSTLWEEIDIAEHKKGAAKKAKKKAKKK